MKDATFPSYEVTAVKADVVYGKIKPKTPNDIVSVTRRTSVRFMESENSRQNSGSPGYLKGYPVLTGDLKPLSTDSTKFFIEQPLSPFSIIGAD